MNLPFLLLTAFLFIPTSSPSPSPSPTLSPAHPNHEDTSLQNTSPEDDPLSSSTSSSTSSYEESSEESPEGDSYEYEEACPRGTFFHIRGRRCVPFKCPVKNSMRNWNTGECLYSQSYDDVKPFHSTQSRIAFKHRNILRRKKLHRFPGRGGVAKPYRWDMTNERTRVLIDGDEHIPIRQIGLIG